MGASKIGESTRSSRMAPTLRFLPSSQKRVWLRVGKRRQSVSSMLPFVVSLCTGQFGLGSPRFWDGVFTMFHGLSLWWKCCVIVNLAAPGNRPRCSRNGPMNAGRGQKFWRGMGGKGKSHGRVGLKVCVGERIVMMIVMGFV